MKLPDYIQEAIKRIQIISRKKVSEIFGGEYRSVFKGKGIEVEEVREYEPGDDIRAIDWKTSARKGALYVKKFREERELSLYLLVDTSASLDFGIYMKKREKAAEAAALLSLAALVNNDKVGLLTFGEFEGKFVPPRKGRGHFLRIIREILMDRDDGTKTNIARALMWVYKVAKKRGIVVIISDFYTERSFLKELKLVSGKHDVIGIWIKDKAEPKLSILSPFYGVDLESGKSSFLWPLSRHLKGYFLRYERTIRGIFKRSGAGLIEVYTNQSAYVPIEEYFRRRR